MALFNVISWRSVVAIFGFASFLGTLMGLHSVRGVCLKLLSLHEATDADPFTATMPYPDHCKLLTHPGFMITQTSEFVEVMGDVSVYVCVV
jgi:hypothetical protein